MITAEAALAEALGAIILNEPKHRHRTSKQWGERAQDAARAEVLREAREVWLTVGLVQSALWVDDKLAEIEGRLTT